MKSINMNKIQHNKPTTETTERYLARVRYNMTIDDMIDGNYPHIGGVCRESHILLANKICDLINRGDVFGILVEEFVPSKNQFVTLYTMQF